MFEKRVKEKNKKKNNRTKCSVGVRTQCYNVQKGNI